MFCNWFLFIEFLFLDLLRMRMLDFLFFVLGLGVVWIMGDDILDEGGCIWGFFLFEGMWGLILCGERWIGLEISWLLWNEGELCMKLWLDMYEFWFDFIFREIDLGLFMCCIIIEFWFNFIEFLEGFIWVRFWKFIWVKSLFCCFIFDIGFIGL